MGAQRRVACRPRAGGATSRLGRRAGCAACWRSGRWFRSTSRRWCWTRQITSCPTASSGTSGDAPLTHVSMLMFRVVVLELANCVFCRYIAQDVLPARKQVLALSATYPSALLVGSFGVSAHAARQGLPAWLCTRIWHAATCEDGMVPCSTGGAGCTHRGAAPCDAVPGDGVAARREAVLRRAARYGMHAAGMVDNCVAASPVRRDGNTGGNATCCICVQRPMLFAGASEGLQGAELQEAKVQRLLRVLSSTTFHQASAASSDRRLLRTAVHASHHSAGPGLRGSVSIPSAGHLQALVFCNSQPDAQALADNLCGLGYPAAFVSGSHAQVCGGTRHPFGIFQL